MRRGTLAGFLCAGVLLTAAPAMAAGPALGFAKAQFLDTELAGGEPIVFADVAHGTLIYSAHEGTTHLYRPGLASSAPASWLANYRNQVNIWISSDNGATFKRVINNNFNGADPSKDQGFSDPDLTQDEGGRVYDTGIDLANDALFSTADGGKTWDKGTAQCHDGDRPWLAGGKKDEVWLATDITEGDPTKTLHTIYHSTDGGDTCSQAGVPDYGDFGNGGSFFAFGKLYYDHQRKQLIEPIIISDKDGNQSALGVSTGTPNADESYKMTPHQAVATPNHTVAHFPTIAQDAAGTVYLVYDTNDRQKGTAGGCGNGPAAAETPAANSIDMVYSKDFGQTWSKPVTIAHIEGKRVLWPWVTAGTAGRVGIVYYQQNNLADIDCQTADISVEAASIAGADTESPQITTVDAVGRPVALNTTICQGGTTCVATGQDRRLGDYMTVSLDPNGCEMIATGDVTQPDPATQQPRQTSLPLFIHQNAGPSLTGGGCGAGPQGSNGFAQGPGGVTASCVDRARPRSRLRGRPVNRAERLTLRGTASDRGCRNAKAAAVVKGEVASVDVAVARRVGKRCAFVKRSDRLTRPRACSKPVYIRAKGTTRWSYHGRRELPNGRYLVWTRATDARGNAERRHRVGSFRIT